MTIRRSIFRPAGLLAAVALLAVSLGSVLPDRAAGTTCVGTSVEHRTRTCETTTTGQTTTTTAIETTTVPETTVPEETTTTGEVTTTTRGEETTTTRPDVSTVQDTTPPGRERIPDTGPAPWTPALLVLGVGALAGGLALYRRRPAA